MTAFYQFLLFLPQLQTSPEYGQGMNPISRLAQIQQAKKEKEPEYMLITERGLPRRREFVMQVCADFSCSFSLLCNPVTSSTHSFELICFLGGGVGDLQ